MDYCPPVNDPANDLTALLYRPLGTLHARGSHLHCANYLSL